VGDRGIVTCGITDPMGVLGGVCKAETLVLLCAARTEVMVRALDTYMERIYGFVEHLLRGGARPVFVIIGPEYITPPLLSPRFFRPLVADYVRRLVELIHAHGALAVIHCHGQLDAVLEALVETGADGLHPVEAPPMGNVTLADAKRRMQGRMCIVGNIQIGDMFDRTPDEIRALVLEAIRDAGQGGGLMLATSATPYQTPLPRKTLENFRALIAAYQTYGVY
jgi:uroporphyrinogen-III decarboxylase